MFTTARFASGLLRTWNWMPSSRSMSWKCLFKNSLPLSVRNYKGGVNHHVIGIETPRWLQGRSSSLWAPDVEISRKHPLQIECICTYHCILWEIACLIYRTPKPPLEWSWCRDSVRTSSWQAYALYRRLGIPTMLWHQTCFSSVLLRPVYLKSKMLSVFQDWNILQSSIFPCTA